MGAPLDNGQKAKICILAREAWEHEGRPGDPQEWRRQEQARACGHGSLRACGQEHYLLLKGHFFALLGREDAAFKALVRHGTEGRRVALWNLQKACRDAGQPYPAYAASLAKKIHRVTLDEASDRVLWFLVFTLRKRSQGKRIKAGVARPRWAGKKSFAARFARGEVAG